MRPELQGGENRPALALHARPRLASAPLALVVVAHAAAIATLMALHAPAVPPQALMVEVIAAAPETKAPVPAPPKADTTPPKPLPVSPQSRPQAAADLPVLATEGPAVPAATEVPKLAPASIQPPIQAAAATAAPSAPPSPAPLTSTTAPRFDADYLDNPVPSYPPLSRRTREEGKVVLHVFVEATGLPGKVELHTSSGFERLDRSAAAAVSRWKFSPARQGTAAVSAWVLIPLVFSLKG